MYLNVSNAGDYWFKCFNKIGPMSKMEFPSDKKVEEILNWANVKDGISLRQEILNEVLSIHDWSKEFCKMVLNATGGTLLSEAG